METEELTKKDDAPAIELPAPVGWVKKIIPKKTGTPQRGDIVFVSPTGKEIKNKRQLEQYLKAHPGGPAALEFDWVTTGDTPRRSARLSEKSNAVEVSASQPPMKKQKRSSVKRGAKEKNDANAEEDAADRKDAASEETDENAKVLDVDMINVREGAPPEKENTSVEDIQNKTETEMYPEIPNAEDVKEKTETHPDNPNAKDADNKTDETYTILDEPSAPEPTVDANTNKSNFSDKNSNGVSKIEELETASEMPDTMNHKCKEAHPATTDSAADSKIEDSKTASELPDMNIDHHLEKETPATSVDNTQPPATAVNQDSLKEKQSVEPSINNNSEAVTGC